MLCVYLFLFQGSGAHRDLSVLTHSFPTRRASDLVGERLDTVPALQRETTHFWNWLSEKPNGKAQSTGRMAWGVTMADGTPVLGNVELKGRALILAVTSEIGRASCRESVWQYV